MDFTKFVKKYEYMCNFYNNDCNLCPLDNTLDSCYKWIFENPETAEKVVNYWTSMKTRANMFKKAVPNCKLTEDQYPMIAPCILDRELGKRCRYNSSMQAYECSGKLCNECRKEYWEELVK